LAAGSSRKVFIPMTESQLLLEDAHLAELLEGRQVRDRLAALVDDPAHPLLLGPALGELLLDAELLRDPGHLLIDGLALIQRLDGLVRKDRVAEVAGALLRRQVDLLGGGHIGQEDVGVARRHRHLVVDADDHLALGLVGKDLDRLVDVTVLVDQGVGPVEPDELDVGAQGDVVLDVRVAVGVFGIAYTVLVRHPLSAHDRIGPTVEGQHRADRVVQHRERGHGQARIALPLARATTGDANVACQRREQHRRPGRGSLRWSVVAAPSPG